MKLSELMENDKAVVSDISGDHRYITRVTSIGLTPGCTLKVIKNDKNRPLLIHARDTVIALNRNECKGIEVQFINETVRQEASYE